MFDIGSSELLLIAVVALLVIGPKDLPRVLNQVGKWVAKARAMTGHLKAGLETMAREAELEVMEKQWAAHNDRIMAEHPIDPGSIDDQPTDGVMTELADDTEARQIQSVKKSQADETVHPLTDPASFGSDASPEGKQSPVDYPPAAA